MISIRQANERGHFKNEWLDSHHSFSFGDYHDPAHMGISVLRVINDDTVIAGGGFPTHSHSNMEIVSYVLEGQLAHKDSMGNGSVIRPGDVQRMSAGSGISHSEFNPSTSSPTNFLQIWLLPKERGTPHSYAQKFYTPDSRRGQLILLISPDGRDNSIETNSDALMYGSLLSEGQSVTQFVPSGYIAYIHAAKGNININGQQLVGGDGATIHEEKMIEITGVNETEAEFLLFILPG